MCHAASLKHVLAMAEMGGGSIQNGASILDAVASLSTTWILVDFQINSELSDSPFQSIHTKFYKCNCIFCITAWSNILISVQAVC